VPIEKLFLDERIKWGIEGQALSCPAENIRQSILEYFSQKAQKANDFDNFSLRDGSPWATGMA